MEMRLKGGLGSVGARGVEADGSEVQADATAGQPGSSGEMEQEMLRVNDGQHAR